LFTYQPPRDGFIIKTESKLTNALSESMQLGLPLKVAKTIVKNICLVVAAWQQHFISFGLVWCRAILTNLVSILMVIF
jgi:hypothetical protein